MNTAKKSFLCQEQIFSDVSALPTKSSKTSFTLWSATTSEFLFGPHNLLASDRASLLLPESLGCQAVWIYRPHPGTEVRGKMPPWPSVLWGWVPALHSGGSTITSVLIWAAQSGPLLWEVPVYRSLCVGRGQDEKWPVYLSGSEHRRARNRFSASNSQKLQLRGRGDGEKGWSILKELPKGRRYQNTGTLNLFRV